MSERQPVTIEAVRRAIEAGRWALTSHARTQAGQRFVDSRGLIEALAGGEILGDYPDDPNARALCCLVIRPQAGRFTPFVPLTQAVPSW